MGRSLSTLYIRYIVHAVFLHGPALQNMQWAQIKGRVVNLTVTYYEMQYTVSVSESIIRYSVTICACITGFSIFIYACFIRCSISMCACILECSISISALIMGWSISVYAPIMELSIFARIIGYYRPLSSETCESSR
jgi:hypothetical protein